MRYWRFWLYSLFCLITTACITPVSVPFGLQKDYLAHIPARIAILPCRIWPQGALFPGQEKTELPADQVQANCDQFDKFILAGFDGQPFMRGISPRVVKALIEKSEQPDLLNDLNQLWFRPSQVCEACQQPGAYYQQVIAPRSDWRTWLSSLSRTVSSSDAVLLPMLLAVSTEKVDDHGLFYMRRAAQVALLLIDSNNGQLIWIGGREAEIRLLLKDDKGEAKPEQIPPWDELWKRVFVDDMWLQFPGRQS